MSLLRRLCVFVSLAAAFGCGWAATEAGPLNKRTAVDDTSEARVIVKYRSDSALMRPLAAGAATPKPQHAAALGARLGLAMKDRWVLGERTQSLSAQGITAAELAKRLAAQPDVEWAEVVHRKVTTGVTPNDPYYGPNQTSITPAVGQWYLRAPDAAAATSSTTVVSSINAIGAWALTTGSAAVTVADLDTGVLFSHPDFANADGSSKLYLGYDFISRTSNSNDGNGVDPDATDPGDWSTASDSCGAGSSSWHGTQTAGIIGAATDNSIGMASVGRGVMIEPVRVLGKCGGFDDDIQAGMLWAAGLSSSPVVNPHPAKVINMSLGSTGSCGTYQQIFDQLTAAGVAVVVAAGNDEGLAVGTPANCVGAIAVGGLRHIGTKVGFSDVGPEVTISAPAGNCVNATTGSPCLYPILTTTNAGTTTATTNTYSDSFNYSVGTSFAAPMVSGTIALMLSVDPTLTLTQIKSYLTSTARAFPTTGSTTGIAQCHAPNAVVQDECYCTTSTCGAGMLDTGAAVSAVAAAVVLPPAVSITPSTTTPSVGDMVTLTGSASANGGRTVTSYRWSITAGSTLASFSGSTAAANATLVASGAGSVTVQFMVTDSAGSSSSTTQTLTISAASVAPPSVSVTPSTSAPTVGASVALTGNASANGGRTITSYQWAITTGGTLASFSGSTTGPNATLVTSGSGTVTVQLTVTDSGGSSATASSTITVAASSTGSSAGGSSSSGGGGAFSFAWLALLALAVLALRRGVNA